MPDWSRLIATHIRAWQPRWREVLFWGLLLTVGPACSLYHFSTIQDPIFSRHRDFGVFWTASTLFWQGDINRMFEPELFRAALAEIMGEKFPYLPFPYPPHALLLLAPLSLLPFLPSLGLWLSIGFAGIIAGLRRFLAQPWLGFVALLVAPASAVNMSYGQNGFLSTALLCGGLLQLPQRQIVAGILFGILSYKPQLGLLIPLVLIAGGYWRAFLAASITVVTMVFVSLVVLGPEAWVLYATKSGPLQAEIAQHWVGQFQSMSPTYFMAGRLVGLPLPLAWTAQIIASLLAIAATMWTFRQDVPHALKAALTMVAVFIVSPYVLTYDLPIVCCATLLAVSTFVPRWWECAIMLAVWVLPASFLPPHIAINPLLLSMLFMILLRRIMLYRAEGAHPMKVAAS